MKALGILFAMLWLAPEGFPQRVVEARPTVYSHRLDPSVYPDYTRRPSRAPTWATFEDRPQFVALRTLPTAAFTNQGLGTVCMPSIDLVSSPNLGQALDELKRRGYYLFDVGGYVPGSVPRQIRVPPETLNLLEATLGDRSWQERQQLRVVVDFTSGLNHFPDLTLLDLIPGHYADSVARMNDVLTKMTLAGATHAVIGTHMTPEFGATPEQVEASFQRGLRDLCRRAKERGITLHLQNRTGRWRGSVPEILRLIDELDADNLRFALNTSCAEVTASLTQAGDRLGMVLVSAPDRQVPEMQRPVWNRGVDLSALSALTVPVVLDAEYAGPDEVFQDVTAVWGSPAKGIKP